MSNLSTEFRQFSSTTTIEPRRSISGPKDFIIKFQGSDLAVKLLQVIIRILYYDQHVRHIESGQAYFPVQISGKVRFQKDTSGLVV